MDELEVNNQSPEPTPAVDLALTPGASGQLDQGKRPPRSHASKSLVRRRINRLIDMCLLGVNDEELLIESLRKEGIERRQAKRYLQKANRELEKAGTGISPRDWGVKMKQADSLLTHAYRDAQREGGDRAAAIQAHKNAVSTMTALAKGKKPTERGDNNDHHPQDGRDTEENRLEKLLHLFGNAQAAGGSNLPG